MILTVVCVFLPLPHLPGRASADLRLQIFKALICRHDEVTFVVGQTVRCVYSIASGVMLFVIPSVLHSLPVPLTGLRFSYFVGYVSLFNA